MARPKSRKNLQPHMPVSNSIHTFAKGQVTLRLFRTFIEIRKGKKRQAVKLDQVQSIDDLGAGKIRIRIKLKQDLIFELAPRDSRKFLDLAEQQLKQHKLETLTSGIAAQKELKKVSMRGGELRALLLPGGAKWLGFGAVEALQRERERAKRHR